MGRDGQDALGALDEARRLRAGLEPLRHAFETADRSRVGRLRSSWFALKSALLGGPEDPNRALVAEESAASLDLAGSGASAVWPDEARAAERAQRDFLRAEIDLLRRNLADVRAGAKDLARERDAGRATAAALRAALEWMRLSAARADASRGASQRNLERLQAELDLLRQGFADARAAEPPLRRALQATRDALERERRAGREARNVSAQLSSLLLHEAGAHALHEPRSALEKKRSLLTASLERSAAILDVAEPDVSVIIPAYEQAGMTLDCLQSIADAAGDGPTMQLIVVDDASPRESVAGALAGLPFVTVLRNGRNLGFLRTCNRAASLATGRYLHFLNNDTLVRPGWLRELVAVAEADPRVGAVGSKLIYADGSLQEAGGIIWRDASGWNYGKGDDVLDPRYNYARDVDYCSGASLLVRGALFRELGGFDDALAPAYYEDVDLCFAIRERRGRVVYQPKSVVVHLEGASSGTALDAGIKRHQALNQPKFAAKWRVALEQHFEPDSVSGMRAARRLAGAKTLVMIDSYVPEPDKDAGSNRLFKIIKLLLQLGVHVIFVPENFWNHEPYSTALQNLGVEVVHHTPKRPHFETALRERLALADFCWVSRVHLASKFAPIVREFPGLPLIYDTVDLHYVRERRALELKVVDDPAHWLDWGALLEREFGVIRGADAVITVSDVERRVLQDEGIANVHVVPTIHDSVPRVATYEETAGVLFIGGYQHPPNVDAAVWLVRTIMPLVWQTHPHIELTLLGSNAPPLVTDLAASRVKVMGFVPEVAPYFERARVFVAPLRYGAGLKGKIGQALGFGVPTVTTSVGAEGFDFIDGVDALIAEDAPGIARAIVRAYDDAGLWSGLSLGGTRSVRRFGSDVARERLAALIER